MNPHTDSRESGITLIEVMVAMTILSVVLISLGGLMFHVARQTQISAAATHRTAAMQRASAWIEGLAWESLDDAQGPSWSLVSGPMTYDQFVDVSPLGPANTKNVRVRILPTGPLAIVGPDTVVVVRTRMRLTTFLQ